MASARAGADVGPRQQRGQAIACGHQLRRASSTRITPRLADRPTGLTTHGKRTRVRRCRRSPCRAAGRTNHGTGRPAASRRPRAISLCVATATAVAMPRQATRLRDVRGEPGGTIADGEHAVHRRRSSAVSTRRARRAVDPMSNRAGIAPSPQGSSRWSQRSDTIRRSRRRGARPRRTRGPGSQGGRGNSRTVRTHFVTSRELPALRVGSAQQYQGSSRYGTVARTSRVTGCERIEGRAGGLIGHAAHGGMTSSTRERSAALLPSHAIDCSCSAIDCRIRMSPWVRERVGVERRRPARCTSRVAAARDPAGSSSRNRQLDRRDTCSTRSERAQSFRERPRSRQASSTA